LADVEVGDCVMVVIEVGDDVMVVIEISDDVKVVIEIGDDVMVVVSFVPFAAYIIEDMSVVIVGTVDQ